MSAKNFLCYGDAETLLAELEVKLEEKANASDLGTAAAKDVPSSGNASSNQVVMGNDTRLSDSRNAKDVSAWAKASTKPSYTASEVGAIATTAKGAANGVAELDSAGKVLTNQLPSFVDDVLEYNSMSAFPATGETGKIYVAKDTNKTYRWSGTAYVEISPSLALGETSSTAYRGDRGKTAYDHSQLTSGNPHNVTKSDVGLGNVPNVSTNDQTPTFTQASSRANIVSGEKLSVIFGKVMKFFSDLKAVAFSGSYTDLDNKPTIPSALADLTSDATHRVVTDTEKSTWNDKQAAISNIGIAEIKTGTATNQRSVQPSVLNPAIKMYCPHYATCTSQAANQKKTVVVADANFQLYTGCIIAVKFDANNTYSATAAAPVMFNVNSTGDKEVRGNSVNAATTGTATNIFGTGNRIISYQYDGTYWVKIGQSWDDNSKYSPQSLGFGYGTCDTAAATAAKAVTLSGYDLVNNGIVSVKFTYDVPASATMNINSKGAKSIYYHGAAITAGIIKAGDIATFMYYNNIYHLIAVDSDHPIEITWDAWNALSSEQRAGKHYIITDVPDATGSLDCELMDLLWKNPNPTAAFGAQDLSLDLTDYDFVVIFTSMSNDEQFTAISRVPKSGETDVWSKVISTWNSGTTVYVIRREYKIYTNKIHFDAAISNDGSASSTHHIPFEIYGIKKSVSFDFSAIAHDVKTDAANCMLSDGVTSVEDKIGNIFFVEKSVSSVSVSMAWGNLYRSADLTIDISSLGLTNAPDVVSVEFSTTSGDIALCAAANITKNNITVFILRGATGTVSGKIMLMLKSNG